MPSLPSWTISIKELGRRRHVAQFFEQVLADAVKHVQTAAGRRFRGGRARDSGNPRRISSVRSTSCALTTPVSTRCSASLQHRVLEPVAHKAGDVLVHDDRHLAQLFRHPVDHVHRVVGCLLASNHLDQRHDLGGVGPVHAAHPLRVSAHRSDVGDAQSRRVGCQDGIVRADILRTAQRAVA